MTGEGKPKKAEREKLQARLAEIQNELTEKSGGSLVLFKYGDGTGAHGDTEAQRIEAKARIAEAQRIIEEATPKVIARTNAEATEVLKRLQGKPLVNRETGIKP